MATTPRSPQIYYSNSVEALEQALRAELFSSNTGPFTRRIVVVSSQAMEQWLRFRFAGPSGLGICMGPEFLFAPKVVQELCGLLGVQAPQTLDPLSLGIRIEAELKQCFDFWPELQRALPEGRGDRRLPLLAKRLASLFDRYQQYGQRVLPHWYHDADAWQKQLWCRLFPDPQAMPALDSIPQELDGSTEVHLFGLAFMPRPMIRFFGAVGRYMPVSQYVLSPCQAFWTDIVSDRSTRRLRLYWKDRGASQAQLDDLDLYLRDRNPLLANFGRLGREFHRSLEDLAGDPIEHYVINQLLDEDDYYAAYRGGEIEPQNDRGQKTLLQWIQADMLFLHKPARGEHRQLSAEDCSLEVHKAPTRQREVEILYDNILRLIHQHSETDSPLLAHEILVMAPDIREYAPFLRAQFGTGDCPLQCQVMDVPLAEQSPYLQAFFSVLDLVDSRWELPRVSELLEHPVVLGHLGWSLDQRLTVRRWLRSLGLSWGMQAQNREDALIRDYCEKGIEGAPQAGTWEFAFRRLLRGLVQQQDAAQRSAGVLAFEGVDASDCELLETLIAYLRGLFSHLDPCGSGEERSLSAWCDHLLCLCDAFLSIPSDEIGWKRDQETLFQAILQLQRLGRELPQAMLSFASVRTRIEDMCAEQARIMNERLFHAVRCCSLVPMRSIPARAIFLLGMSKDDFPRQDETQSLNLLRNESEADYCPSRVDFDRYLFLES
ncbi:MAG: exodeoxyribonuclease V subunit gamma, partial [Chlamydiia bacterium]|nr:exodeoxyribonuclease V subunit gamma [Chlamydiia bacterium]